MSRPSHQSGSGCSSQPGPWPVRHSEQSSPSADRSHITADDLRGLPQRAHRARGRMTPNLLSRTEHWSVPRFRDARSQGAPWTPRGVHRLTLPLGAPERRESVSSEGQRSPGTSDRRRARADRRRLRRVRQRGSARVPRTSRSGRPGRRPSRASRWRTRSTGRETPARLSASLTVRLITRRAPCDHRYRRSRACDVLGCDGSPDEDDDQDHETADPVVDRLHPIEHAEQPRSLSSPPGDQLGPDWHHIWASLASEANFLRMTPARGAHDAGRRGLEGRLRRPVA